MSAQKRVESLLNNEGFTTCPGDSILIIETRAITSDLPLQLRAADGTEFTFSLPNRKAVWGWLQRFNEMGGREVFVQQDHLEIPMKLHPAYQFRFNA